MGVKVWEYQAEMNGDHISTLYRRIGYMIFEEFNWKTKKWETTDEAAYVWLGKPNSIDGKSTWNVSEEDAKEYLKEYGVSE